MTTTYNIFMRPFTPVDYFAASLGDPYTTLAEATEICAHLNNKPSNDMYLYMVVDSTLVENAWQEAECWFAEHGVKACTQDEFDAKHMYFVELFATHKTLEAIGKATA